MNKWAFLVRKKDIKLSGCKKKTGGFSFIEVLLASAILTLIMTGVVVLFNSAVVSWRLGEAKNILAMNTSNILLHLTKDLKKACVSTIVVDNYPDSDNSKVQRIRFKSSLNSHDAYAYYVSNKKYNQIECFINDRPAPYSPLCPMTKSESIIVEELKFNLTNNCQIILELKKYVEGIKDKKFKNQREITTVAIRVR